MLSDDDGFISLCLVVGGGVVVGGGNALKLQSFPFLGCTAALHAVPSR